MCRPCCIAPLPKQFGFSRRIYRICLCSVHFQSRNKEVYTATGLHILRRPRLAIVVGSRSLHAQDEAVYPFRNPFPCSARRFFTSSLATRFDKFPLPS